MQTEEQHRQKKIEIMEKCFECYAEHGLTGTGVQMLADACGFSKSNLYSYFKNLDELIIESTAYCMEKVEDDLSHSQNCKRHRRLDVCGAFYIYAI